MPQEVLYGLENDAMLSAKALAELEIPAEVKKDIATVVKILLTKYNRNISKIILFGSYATGRYQADSDIDIMVALNELPALRDRREYKQAADSIDRDMDLLFCTNEQLSGSAYVFRRVNEQGVTLYEQL